MTEGSRKGEAHFKMVEIGSDELEITNCVSVIHGTILKCLATTSLKSIEKRTKCRMVFEQIMIGTPQI